MSGLVPAAETPPVAGGMERFLTDLTERSVTSMFRSVPVDVAARRASETTDGRGREA